MTDNVVTLDDVAAQLNKRFGSGSVMLHDEAPHMIVDRISTGSISIDQALGGGIPRGRVTEIYGPESSGKSTLCLHVIAEAQKAGLNCAFIDMEHALDREYAQKLGVEFAEMAVSQPDDGETALEMCEYMVRSGVVDVIVIDSVAALVPKKELEGDMGDAVVGLQARLMSQAMRKMSGAIKQTNTAVIFTNQLRQKIGVMFGNPETTTGGLALKFYASVRMDIRRIQALKVGTDVIGARTRVRVVKNKVAPPFKVAEFDILYNEGISKTSELIDLGVDYGVVTKKGSFIYVGEERLGQGKDAARKYLVENPEFAATIEKDIREAIKEA